MSNKLDEIGLRPSIQAYIWLCAYYNWEGPFGVGLRLRRSVLLLLEKDHTISVKAGEELRREETYVWWVVVGKGGNDDWRLQKRYWKYRFCSAPRGGWLVLTAAVEFVYRYIGRRLSYLLCIAIGCLAGKLTLITLASLNKKKMNIKRVWTVSKLC